MAVGTGYYTGKTNLNDPEGELKGFEMAIRLGGEVGGAKKLGDGGLD